MTSSLITLPARSILRLSGEETRGLLQGLITANIRHLEEGKALYSALLSPQGKMQADFFVYDAGNDTILIDVDEARAKPLLSMLKMYKLRAKITMEDASAEWRVLAALEHVPTDAPAGSIIVRDPRTPLFAGADLGYRVLVPRTAELQSTDDCAEYETRRIARGLMDGARDYTVDRSLALELGLDAQGAIDFAKGCYVGQEVTNRSKHRATLRKMIGRVESADGAALPAPGTTIMAGDKEVGELRSNFGLLGLAQLRMEEIQAAQQTGVAITANGVALKAFLPNH